MHRMAVVGLAVVIVACGSPSAPTPTPAPRASVPADVQERGEQAVDAFLTAMADPDVTYRVTGVLRVGRVDENGRPDILVNTYYDVKGGQYAGRLDIHLRDPTIGGDFTLAVIDDTAHVYTSRLDASESMDAPETLRRPDALQGLGADDLALVGMTDEGLFEFAVAPWLAGDPLGEWVDLGAVPQRALPHTELRWHDTRLFLDEAGVPERLTHAWQFDTPESDEAATGTIVEEIVGLGMYVKLPAGPLDLFAATSHNVADGPWRPIAPDAASASLEVVYRWPDEPILLGIEGAIFFVGSHDADDEPILDAILGMEDHGTLEIPVGEQTLTAYYRTCNGNCANLDAIQDFCTVAADIRAGVRYRLTVEVLGMHRAVPATCTVETLG